jgi:predicted dehydrogenase/acetyltransferase-like isoleucine patch superfamily enzyme
MAPKTESATPNVAVVGSGYWGKHLVRNYHELKALRLICDTNETVLSAFKKNYPDVETCLALNDVLLNEDVAGIVIATPAEMHYSFAREAILAGKHVYVEKPLVLHENEAEELIALAAEHDRILMVGHLLQYHPVFVELKKMATNGELGRINYIYSNRLNLGKIRREENILWSFAPHDISMILALAGEEPESVVATGGNYLHKRIADVTTTHLTFSSGLQAHVFVSWLHPFKEQKLVVVGDKKMAVFNDTKAWDDKLFIFPHKIIWENNFPVPDQGEPERLDIPPDEPLRLECRHFLKCIAAGKQPLTDGQEGLRVLKVLNAAQKSIDRNSAIIRLDRPGSRGSGREEEGRGALFSPSGSMPAADNFIHETAIVDDNSHIGQGTKIWHFTHVLSGTSIDENCNIGQNVMVGPDVRIGKRCKIQNNVSVYKGVTLEDGVFCGPSMVFTNIFNPRAEIRKMGQVRPTLVKKGATIGANATVICGATIGRYAFVGAGSVVTRSVKDYALVAGNPARQIGWACQCGERLPDDLACSSCGNKYEERVDELWETKPKEV